ncbi:CsxC family protein [Guptibacillus hwajinpoensis]|uniref:CsxC family protein n=1 Tax=Guptibacillus hwajinpoensis TaxID=208199 RepID=UPI00069ED480|nr:hypothetical protein [Alkalihalobacillus macyae]
MEIEPRIRSAAINECIADEVPVVATSGSGTIVKVPVLLQKLTIQIPTHATIEFPEDEHVLEIKDIKKRVFLTQCKVLHEPGKNEGTLFMSGYVRKNIHYASNPISCNRNEIQTKDKSLTVNIPFECYTTIESFLTQPVGPFFNTRKEFNFKISAQLPSGYPEKDELLSDDLSQFSQQSTEFFNELPFCELVKAEILEIDQSLNRKPGKIIKPFPEKKIILECTCTAKEEMRPKKKKNRRKKSSLFDDRFTVHIELPKERVGKTKKECLHCKEKNKKKETSFEGIFTEMSEKMILNLTVTLLQKQLVQLS